MSDIQDAAPSSTEPLAPAGEPSGGASAPVVTESSGTTPQTTDTPSTQTGVIQTARPMENQSPSTIVAAGTTAEPGNAGTGTSGSTVPVDSLSSPSMNSGASAASSGSQATGQEAGSEGNQPGPADSADIATSTDVAPLSPATADAVATFADMMDRFETKTYADGSTVRTIGELPSDSVVTYPERVEPVDDSPLGWCNQLDQFIVKATGSSRTDGNRLVAKLRDYLQSA